MKSNLVLRMGVFALGLFLLCPSAFADSTGFLGKLETGQGNIKLSDLHIHPGVEVEGQYNDNIYNTSENEEEDTIFTLTPGILFTLGKDYRFVAGYAADIVSYMDNDDEDFVGQSAKGSADLNFPSGFQLVVSDDYLKTEDPRAEARQVRASHWTNDANASLFYSFPGRKFKIGGEYALSYLKYDQEDNESSNKRKDSGTASISYRFFPKTSAFLEYTYLSTDFFDSQDEDTDKRYKSNGGNVGLKWDATAKLTGTLKTGYESINYENDYDASGNRYEDKNLWSVSGNLIYKATKTLNISLTLNRSLDDTEYGGDSTGEFSSAAYFVNTGGSIGLTKTLFEKLSLGADFGYMNHDYSILDDDLDAREDDVYEATVKAGYAITKHLSIDAKYAFTEYESNDDEKDETHNKVFVSISAVL